MLNFLSCKISEQMEKMKVVAEKKAKEDRARLEAEVHYTHANAPFIFSCEFIQPRKRALVGDSSSALMCTFGVFFHAKLLSVFYAFAFSGHHIRYCQVSFKLNH